MNNSLSAPGRMDVIEQVLASDPFFQSRMRGSGTRILRNRRGIQKRYSNLTVEMVAELARNGLDAVNMRRDEVIARAFQFFVLEGCAKEGCANQDEIRLVA